MRKRKPNRKCNQKAPEAALEVKWNDTKSGSSSATRRVTNDHLRSTSRGDHCKCLGLARMAYGGTTRSCWNFEPATAAGRQSSDTELTPQETCSRNCSTTHTSWSTGRTRATGSCREAQVFMTMTYQMKPSSQNLHRGSLCRP
jgi:hypothetical protein